MLEGFEYDENFELLFGYLSKNVKFNEEIPALTTVLAISQKQINASVDLWSRLEQNGPSALPNLSFGIIGSSRFNGLARRKGDIEDPRGGVRGVIPERQKYRKK